MREPIAKGLPVNAFGQLEKIKYSDGSVEKFIHDAEGCLLVYIDPQGLQTQYEYDAAGLISLACFKILMIKLSEYLDVFIENLLKSRVFDFLLLSLII